MTTVKESISVRLILYGIAAFATVGLGFAGPIHKAYSTQAWTAYASLALSVAAFTYLLRRINHHERKQVEATVSGRPSLTPEEFGNEHFSGVAVSIAAGCREIFADCYPFDSSRIHPDDKLCEDLRFAAQDCLDADELLLATEERFQIKFSTDEKTGMRTMRDIVDAVARRRAEESKV